MPATYKYLKNKDIDVFIGNWMPAMEGDIAKYRDGGSVGTNGSVGTVLNFLETMT